ncbi:MAG: VWA domain-containing protein [Planctomycetota bacterium]
MGEWLEWAAGLRLEAPWFLLLVLPLGLAFALGRRRGPLILFAGARFLDPPLPARARALWLPDALRLCGAVLAVLALARPIERSREAPSRLGVDVMLCTDCSSSMAAEDLAPGVSRLDLAKAEAEKFVRGRPDDRLGLMTFARYPDLLCPPTLDHEVLLEMLAGVSRVEPDGPEDATAIGLALVKAARVLDRARGPSRVVVLLTDGEENVAVRGEMQELPPESGALLCARLGIRVYAISLAPAGGHAAPAADLVAMAARTGGRSYAVFDARGLAAVYAEIDALEKALREEPLPLVEDRFLALLLAGILAWAAGTALCAGRAGVLP